MVLLEAIAGGTLFALKSPLLIQQVVALMMVVSISAITVLVIWMIVYFALKRPGLLFNPRDIAPSVHRELYAPGETPEVPIAEPGGLSFVLTRQEDVR